MIKLQPKPVKEYAYIGIEINLKDKELLSLFEKIDRFKEEDKQIIKSVINAFAVKSKIDELQVS